MAESGMVKMTVSNSLADYSSLESLSEIWPLAAQRFGDIVALDNPHSSPETIITYSQLNQQIQNFAKGLQSLGIKEDVKVALFADNSPRWFIADQGIMTAGAANVVRSSQAERTELLYILTDSDSIALVVEDIKTLNKLRPELDSLPIELIVLLSDEQPPSDNQLQKILNWQQLLKAGENYSLQPVKKSRHNLATLIYTSGTTGKPKGAMLSHRNLLHQVNNFKEILQPLPGDRVLSILPSWHAYERTCEYYLLSQGCTQYYTNIRNFKKDLKQFKPHYMVGVPRIWEAIYEGIQKELREQPQNKQKLINFFLKVSWNYILNQRIAKGLSLDHLKASSTEKLKASLMAALLKPLYLLADKIVYQKIRQAVGGVVKSLISGGGSLAKHIDNFYEIVGITILVGYGLTETSPVTNVRRLNHNMRGTAGQPLQETEIKIVNPETRQPLPLGEKGLVLIRGTQVMQGYYKKPEATAKAIDAEGWFDSGDLGWVTPSNDLVLTGRAKDTIVLTNGENIEPQPIEDACLRSPYIDQIMLVGQDQRSLGALIVPNLDALKVWAQTEEVDISSKAVQELFRKELTREVQNRPGYRIDDRIGPFELLLEPFSIENGMMTQTLKIKRPVVYERYHDIIEKMFKD